VKSLNDMFAFLNETMDKCIDKSIKITQTTTV